MAATVKITRKDGTTQTLEVKPGLKIEIRPGDVISIAGASATGAQTEGDNYILQLSGGEPAITLVNFVPSLIGDNATKLVFEDGTEIANLQAALNLVATAAGGAQEDDIRQAPEEYETDPFLVPPPPQGPLNQDFPFDELPTLEPLTGVPSEGEVNLPPDACDDMDMVMEGGMTRGNVITGEDPDEDPINIGMLWRDTDPEGDPLIIRCIEHEGVVYELSADGTSVSVVEGEPTHDWYYDDKSGVLKIISVKGGILEINLDGPNPDYENGESNGDQESVNGWEPSEGLTEIGDYKYTAPDSVRHLSIEDGIPLNDPMLGTMLSLQEILDLYDEVDLKAWEANGSEGSFEKKNVNFTLNGVQYKYSGIGVAGGGDFAETDFRPQDGEETDDGYIPTGGAESVKIHYEEPETEAYIGIGALFDGTVDGAPFDKGFVEKLHWEAFLNGESVGSGHVSGTDNGLVTLEILIEGGFDKIELTPVDNGAGDSGSNSDFLLMYVHGEHMDVMDDKFIYKIEDTAGNQDSAMLKISVKDDEPEGNDDMDMVDEGDMTHGNVVTGEDPDTEPNMLQADDFGQDSEGAFIYKIEHNGQEYGMANADEDGNVMIQTELGGLLKFNLLTGEYWYEAPKSLVHKALKLSAEFKSEDAGFDNTLGYVILDDMGNPTTGQIMFASSDASAGDMFMTDLVGVTEDQVAFFLIPDGNDLNGGLANGDEITFALNLDGEWAAFKDGAELSGANEPAFFWSPEVDLSGLNPDNVNHVQEIMMAFGWEDLPAGQSDDDFNDAIWNFTLEHLEKPMFFDEFTYTLVDGDWDLDTAQLKIKVKDTEPEAKDDKDMVQEGGMTTGNVITGEDPDQDLINQGMLQEDWLSQDDPHIIKQVQHNGETYELVDGKVTFETELGGIFTIYENGNYKYTAPKSLDHSPFHVEVGDVPEYVDIYAFGKDGQDATVLSTAHGFGVDSNNDGGVGGRFNEINYVDNPGTGNDGSETLVFKLDGRWVNHAKINLSKFFKFESFVGNEKGMVQLFKHGELVESDNFTANSFSGQKMIEVWADGGFDEIRFTAKKGSFDFDGGDSSDYYVESIWFGRPTIGEEFTYTLADGDWDDGATRPWRSRSRIRVRTPRTTWT